MPLLLFDAVFFPSAERLWGQTMNEVVYRMFQVFFLTVI